MAYATQADIETIYSPDALHVADRDGDGVVDAAAVARALDAASDEVDTYLGSRYAVPLPNPTAFVVQLTIDIALYRLALARDVLTAEARQRYEDAIGHLKSIASGKAALPVGHQDGGEGEGSAGAADLGPRPLLTHGPEREFNRDKMVGL
ncbi:MAG: phage protein Gp36 family protein [Shimia sp.]